MKAQSHKLLLVEDNPADMELVEAFLEQGMASDFALEHAGALATALRKIEQEFFDIILLDLFLPDSMGLETFRSIHAHAGQIPIVILSGANDENDALSAVRMGAQDYLVKGKTDSFMLSNSLRFAIERAARLKRYVAKRTKLAREVAEIAGSITMLTPREREILELIADRKSLKQIASILGTSYNTVKNQRARIQDKLNARTEADLVRMVMIVRFGGGKEPHRPEPGYATP